MRHVFYLSGDHPAGYAQAEMLVGSLRRVGVTEIVQHTDGVSKAFPGVEVVRMERGDENLMVHRFRMMKGEVESVCCDTDMIFLENLDEVLEKDFDVAMSVRKSWGIKNGKLPRQIHNGIVICKNPGFWRDAYADLISDPWKSQWKHVDKSYTTARWNYNCLELPASEYNFQPLNLVQDVRGKKVLHFKAWRKELMSAYNPGN